MGQKLTIYQGIRKVKYFQKKYSLLTSFCSISPKPYEFITHHVNESCSWLQVYNGNNTLLISKTWRHTISKIWVWNGSKFDVLKWVKFDSLLGNPKKSIFSAFLLNMQICFKFQTYLFHRLSLHPKILNMQEKNKIGSGGGVYRAIFLSTYHLCTISEWKNVMSPNSIFFSCRQSNWRIPVDSACFKNPK